MVTVDVGGLTGQVGWLGLRLGGRSPDVEPDGSTMNIVRCLVMVNPCCGTVNFQLLVT